jgi:hypothetical protein
LESMKETLASMPRGEKQVSPLSKSSVQVSVYACNLTKA